MIADLIAALVGPLGGLLAGIVAVVGALVLGRRQGRQSEAQRRAGQDARDYRDTRRRMDDASSDDPGPDHVRDWLRERGRKPGGDL